MCHSNDSRPPAAPTGGAVASHGPIRLSTADGFDFPAYEAIPATANGRGVVLLPDIRGVAPFYRELAQRFAEAGFHTVAYDYFFRTAGSDARGDDFDFRPHIARLRREEVVAQTAAAAARIDGRVFSVGFCLGGGLSWQLAASGIGLAGTIGFYGLPHFVDEVLEDVAVPQLYLLAGADVATPPEAFQALRERLDRAGKTYEMHTYDGAPHSFFDRAQGEWSQACDDAWRRILRFTAA
ncbi:dienelactone hydrolase family protein [Fodinicola acaciae]|uniref:dienelactone hydrolase family protein n=1 Tax=Fodinicola acaciae TaxID=2681555 RepID=UPI0013D3E443|nr:dienelactone hydrolase family protein [Fodinicola acaciae]